VVKESLTKQTPSDLRQAEPKATLRFDSDRKNTAGKNKDTGAERMVQWESAGRQKIPTKKSADVKL